MPDEYTGAPCSNSTVAGAGTGKLRARTSPCRRPHSAASRRIRRRPGLGAHRRADDIDHRIDRADFVEVDRLDVGVVNLGLGRAQGLEDRDRRLLRSLS